MRIVFMGTPDFAVNTLESIINAGHEVLLVVTQPDKAKGRGKKLIFSPVKETALKYNLDVAQPKRVKEEGFVERLTLLAPDVIVVVAYGQILPESILNIPRYGCINVHASLLPEYRGAAPIQWAVIDGLKETGVTTMYMDKGLDTGDIIDQKIITIDENETGGSLFDRLAVLGGDIIVETLEKIVNGTATRTKQNDDLSSYAKMLSKDMGNLDFSKDAVVLERLIRGLNPWPSAYTKLYGKMLKVFAADVINEDEIIKIDGGLSSPGCIVAVEKKSFTVRCGNGGLAITSLQLEGKKRMDTAAFMLGYIIETGILLG